jgi:hypothetical protein
VLEPERIESVEDAHRLVTDLVAFLNQFDKGRYYHAQVSELIVVQLHQDWVVNLDEPDSARERRKREHDERELARFRRVTVENRRKILELVVEMLRYQPWAEQFAQRGRK